jgi:hypothetical protein
MNFFTLLAVLFIGLKLTNFITWSWWLVLLPLYGGLGIAFGIMFFGFIVTVIFGKPSYKFKR